MVFKRGETFKPSPSARAVDFRYRRDWEYRVTHRRADWRAGTQKIRTFDSVFYARRYVERVETAAGVSPVEWLRVETRPVGAWREGWRG